MTAQLITHIQQLLPGYIVPVKEMSSLFETITVKKEQVLLHENEPCENIYFVNSGCLYLFYHQQEQLQVVHFALENWWITDYKTFAEAKPAVYSIAAMEDSAITLMSRKNYEKLLLQFPLMALYFNKIHERAYGAALYKQRTMATSSKEDFYRYFRSTYPTVIQRIPDAVFAAYIGVSVEILQAIKKACIS